MDSGSIKLSIKFSGDSAENLIMHDFPHRGQSQGPDRTSTETSSLAPSKFRGRQTGGAVVEVAFLIPWIMFLFVGVLDTGFYCYALIVTQNAARVSVLQSSISTAAASDSVNACLIALQEMVSLPNMAGVNTCGSGSVSASVPVSVVAGTVDHGSGDVASRVTVMYLTLPLVPIPGILPQQMTLTRSAEVRVGT